MILSLDLTLLTRTEVEFIPHASELSKDFVEQYLARNVAFDPVKKVYQQLKIVYPGLINRGEAHITVITPPEYQNKLSKYVSIGEINSIALSRNIQKTKFDIKGLGSGSAVLEGEKQETFFLIVDSPEIVSIRNEILDLAKSRRASLTRDDYDYFPHITVGFTKRDLFASDGVLKGYGSLDNRFPLSIS